MHNSLQLTTFWDINLTSRNLNINYFKYLNISSENNGLKLEINHRKSKEKKTDYMETKPYATRSTMGQ